MITLKLKKIVVNSTNTFENVVAVAPFSVNNIVVKANTSMKVALNNATNSLKGTVFNALENLTFRHKLAKVLTICMLLATTNLFAQRTYHITGTSNLPNNEMSWDDFIQDVPNSAGNTYILTGDVGVQGSSNKNGK